jgi:hypothetical protein
MRSSTVPRMKDQVFSSINTVDFFTILNVLFHMLATLLSLSFTFCMFNCEIYTPLFDLDVSKWHETLPSADGLHYIPGNALPTYP